MVSSRAVHSTIVIRKNILKQPDKFQTRKIVQSVHLIMIHFNLQVKNLYMGEIITGRFYGGPFHVQIDVVKRIRQNPLGLVSTPATGKKVVLQCFIY